MMHQALDDSDQTRKYGIAESIIQAFIMTLLQTMSNIWLVSWISDAILSREGGAYTAICEIDWPVLQSPVAVTQTRKYGINLL